jgi:hypothetical protein
MIVMDSIQSEDSVLLDKTKIKYITINPKPVWLEIVDQCVEKLIN